MTPELSTILTTTATAIVAGVISYLAGLGMKRREWRLLLVRERIVVRERLYADFLALASAHVLEAVDKKSSNASAFRSITEKMEHIALVSSSPVTKAAQDLWSSVIDAHRAEMKGEIKFPELKVAYIREARLELDRLEAKG